MSEIEILLRQLLVKKSISPDDASCQDLIGELLTNIGFKKESFIINNNSKDNKKINCLWAYHGSGSPVLAFSGHTDVVPAGPINDWFFDPFTPTEKQGFLYARGAVDMKSGLAAMIIAAKNYIIKNPNHAGTIAFIITSDEELSGLGTQHIMKILQKRQININYCVVGEPSSKVQLGDQIRIGRRGSLIGNLTIIGKSGHVAYPNLAINAVHRALPVLQKMVATSWDKGNKYFPPTTFQICGVNTNSKITNVVPGKLEILFNFRYSSAFNHKDLECRVKNILKYNNLRDPEDYSLNWRLSGAPFLTKPGKLIAAAQEAIAEVVNIEPKLSTGGGTSDGRFIAPFGAEVIEFGPVNKTIHKVNECIKITDLKPLSNIYKKIINILI